MGWFRKETMGEDNRDYVVENLKEGVSPEVVEDWGEYDKDHPPSNGADSREDTELFYSNRKYTTKDTD